MGIKYTFKDAGEFAGITRAGDHKITVKTAFSKLSTKGHDIIVLTLENEEGESIKDELHFTDAAAWRIDVVLKATGLAAGMDKGHEVEIEPDVFVGQSATVTCGYEEYEKDGEKKKFMKVKRWLLPEAKPALKKLVSKKADDLVI